MSHYTYEIIGGVLIFLSSLVSEAFPKKARIALWIVFAALAVAYTAFGIHLDKEAASTAYGQQTESERKTKELRDEVQGLRSNTSNLINTFSGMFSMIASLNADLSTLRRDTAAAKEHHDPRLISDLERQAKVAQQQADAFSQELLTITMAPQIAEQLREWHGTRKVQLEGMNTMQYEQHSMWREKHPNAPDGDPEGQAKAFKEWDESIALEEQKFDDQLAKTIATGDFIRKQLLQRIPYRSAEDIKQEKEFAQTQGTPQSLEKAAHYLEDLARRVPPPPKGN